MKKISALLTFLILVGIFIPAVSADEIIIDELLSDTIDTSSTGDIKTSSLAGSKTYFNKVYFRQMEKYGDLSYLSFMGPGNQAFSDTSGTLIPNGEYAFTYTIDGVTKDGTAYISRSTNLFGSVINTRTILFFYDWDNTGLSGVKMAQLSFYPVRGYAHSSGVIQGTPAIYIADASGYYPGSNEGITYAVASSTPWYNELTVVKTANAGYNIQLSRTPDTKPYPSTIFLNKTGETVFTQYGTSGLLELWRPQNEIDEILVTSFTGKEFLFPLESGDAPTGPDSAIPVTVYVRNSQTGALLANAYINISASVNGNLHEVVNETSPSGIYSIDLQPTGGGMPNPDFYRLITTAEGYNSIMPHIDFEVDGATTIYAYLDPIGGAPKDENNTFIDFFVRDMSANPISGATVNFGGYTLITNSAGYTIFEVDKNKTYSWTVSKSGYGSLTGNAVIGSNARHTINTVLAPAVTPTTPTAIPTSTSISPTPTMTAPTGEPTSNLLEWFAAHFGMILGGGAEIGKIFMWLCFSVPVGVYVGKEAKAGAAGFMAGAGIVTLFFVLIGWVPIWLLVLLALIIGLLYAKIFNNSDNGGGR